MGVLWHWFNHSQGLPSLPNIFLTFIRTNARQKTSGGVLKYFFIRDLRKISIEQVFYAFMQCFREHNSMDASSLEFTNNFDITGRSLCICIFPRVSVFTLLSKYYVSFYFPFYESFIIASVFSVIYYSFNGILMAKQRRNFRWKTIFL